jgi:hypothetical protein
LGVMVTKANGSRQLFDRNKIVKTCMRMGATRRDALEVAGKMEKRLYDGISTAKILQMLFQFMRKYKPHFGQIYDLRKGLSLMASKPEFEIFVQNLLSHNGFDVSSNRILKGKCIEHEVDGIAKKNGVTYLVEAKHHVNYHIFTGLDESRIARAVLEDVTEGYDLGRGGLKIDKAMIITNTKYSDYATQYGVCKDILQIGWSTPANLSLQSMIEEKSLYPLSCVKGLNIDTRLRLVDSGLVLINQIMEEDSLALARKTGLPLEAISKLRAKMEPIDFLRY